MSENGNGVQAHYTNEDLQIKFTNASLDKLFRITFLIILMFLINPFVAYTVFKNSGAIEVTFSHLLQIYSYSLTIFVPLGFVHCFIYPLARLRLILTVAAACISLYYIYKETREFVVKYLEGQDEQTLRYMKIFTVGSVSLFAFLFRYYFMSA